MRLWVPHDQRRPQPAPVATNDARAFAVGLGLWGLALAFMLLAPLVWPSVDGMLSATPLADQPRALTTALLGLGLGALGLLVSMFRRGRASR